PARHHAGGGAGQVRLPARGVQVRSAAARRHRHRLGPHLHAAVRQRLHPRGHRVPPDPRGVPTPDLRAHPDHRAAAAGGGDRRQAQAGRRHARHRRGGRTGGALELKTLVVGVAGHLGDGGVGRWSAERDITDRAAVLGYVMAYRPAVVVNCAYRNDSWAVCADGAAYVAVAATALGARLIHLSTDALHAGRRAPYLDAEPPPPVHAYGAAKTAPATTLAAVDT